MNEAIEFNLAQFELQDTAVLTVQNAKGDDDLLFAGKPVRITLYGSGSAQYAKAEHRAVNAASARTLAAYRGKAVKNASEINATELAERLAACTVAIENFPIEGGALALYSNNRLAYIRKQVVKFLDDDANFTKGSATS